MGHIFKLGTKYSEAMGLSVLDKDQKNRPVIMGCYGIGVSRTLAACVEMSHDDNGIVMPLAIAPYHVEIVTVKPEEDGVLDAANERSPTSSRIAASMCSSTTGTSGPVPSSRTRI